MYLVLAMLSMEWWSLSRGAKDFERVMSTCAVLLRSSGGVFAAAST